MSGTVTVDKATISNISINNSQISSSSDINITSSGSVNVTSTPTISNSIINKSYADSHLTTLSGTQTLSNISLDSNVLITNAGTASNTCALNVSSLSDGDNSIKVSSSGNIITDNATQTLTCNLNDSTNTCYANKIGNINLNTTSGPATNKYLFSADNMTSSWQDINHSDILNHGTTTHSTLDSYIDLASVKGDIRVHNGTTYVKCAAGSDNTVLQSNSADPNGVSWLLNGGLPATKTISSFTTSMTLNSTYSNKYLIFNLSANSTITIPLQTSQNIQVGSVFDIINLNNYKSLCLYPENGISLNGCPLTYILGQYNILIKIGLDSWYIVPYSLSPCKSLVSTYNLALDFYIPFFEDQYFQPYHYVISLTPSTCMLLYSTVYGTYIVFSVILNLTTKTLGPRITIMSSASSAVRTQMAAAKYGQTYVAVIVKTNSTFQCYYTMNSGTSWTTGGLVCTDAADLWFSISTFSQLIIIGGSGIFATVDNSSNNYIRIHTTTNVFTTAAWVISYTITDSYIMNAPVTYDSALSLTFMDGYPFITWRNNSSIVYVMKGSNAYGTSWTNTPIKITNDYGVAQVIRPHDQERGVTYPSYQMKNTTLTSNLLAEYDDYTGTYIILDDLVDMYTQYCRSPPRSIKMGINVIMSWTTGGYSALITSKGNSAINIFSKHSNTRRVNWDVFNENKRAIDNGSDNQYYENLSQPIIFFHYGRLVMCNYSRTTTLKVADYVNFAVDDYNY